MSDPARTTRLEKAVAAGLKLRKAFEDIHAICPYFYVPKGAVKEFDALIEQLKKEANGANHPRP